MALGWGGGVEGAPSAGSHLPASSLPLVSFSTEVAYSTPYTHISRCTHPIQSPPPPPYTHPTTTPYHHLQWEDFDRGA